jgi:hypothetical protein
MLDKTTGTQYMYAVYTEQGHIGVNYGFKTLQKL